MHIDGVSKSMKMFSGDSSLSNAGNALANYAGNRSGLLGGYNTGKDIYGQAQNPFAQFAPTESSDESTQNDDAKMKALNSSLIGQTTPQPIAPNSAPQKSSGIGSLLGMLLAAV